MSHLFATAWVRVQAGDVTYLQVRLHRLQRLQSPPVESLEIQRNLRIPGDDLPDISRKRQVSLVGSM